MTRDASSGNRPNNPARAQDVVPTTQGSRCEGRARVEEAQMFSSHD